MSNKDIKLFPNRRRELRSCEFTVGCGEVGLMTAYDLPCNYSVCVNKITRDRCKCEYFEKEYCQLGERAGLNDCQTEAAITMPGCYVAVLCYTGCGEDPGTDDDWAVYVNVCEAHQNLQTLLQAASLGD